MSLRAAVTSVSLRGSQYLGEVSVTGSLPSNARPMSIPRLRLRMTAESNVEIRDTLISSSSLIRNYLSMMTPKVLFLISHQPILH